MTSVRTCRECSKPEGEVRFYATRRTNICSGCENQMRVARRAANGEGQWADRLGPAARTKYYRANRLRYRFGIELAEYEAMLASQDGRCAICHGEPEPGRWLCVDHDHATGKVRALLCDLCNRTMGQAGDNPDLLERMAAYLRQHAVRHAPGR